MKLAIAAAVALALVALVSAELKLVSPRHRRNVVAPEASPFPGNLTQSTGYITVNGTYDNGVHLFYWEFQAVPFTPNAPLVIWLTGGPGCSSELALFGELGPYEVDNTSKVTLNPSSWHLAPANLIFVDQPVGTGFSYADSAFDYVFSETGVADDFLTFIQNYLNDNPHLRNVPLFITGESYAGHYVPAISARIVRSNLAKEGPQILLQGSAIGNGWVDPYTQYGAYAPFALQNGMIGQTTYDALQPAYKLCQALIDSGVFILALDECNAILETILAENPGVNVYNIKEQCTYPPLCYDFSGLTNLLNDPAVQKLLGVNVPWVTCSNVVHELLLDDWIHDFKTDIPLLLAQPNYRVLVYSGNIDFICNWFGGRAWTHAMAWPGQSGFNSQSSHNYTVNGQAAGSVKTYQGLTWLEVFNAGHMVPMDQPVAALDMLRRFINGTPF